MLPRRVGKMRIRQRKCLPAARRGSAPPRWNPPQHRCRRCPGCPPSSMPPLTWGCRQSWPLPAKIWRLHLHVDQVSDRQLRLSERARLHDESAFATHLGRLSVSGRTSSCTQRGGRCQTGICSSRQSVCHDDSLMSTVIVSVVCSSLIPNTPIDWFDDPGCSCNAAENANLQPQSKIALSMVSRTACMRMNSHHDMSHRGRVQMQLVLQKIRDCKPCEAQNALHQVHCMRKHTTVFVVADARVADQLRTAHCSTCDLVCLYHCKRQCTCQRQQATHPAQWRQALATGPAQPRGQASFWICC